ncbi:MAG: SIS domain-containing protein [Fidelibacterota bacterium]
MRKKKGNTSSSWLKSIEKGREVVKLEKKAIDQLESRINENFATAVDLIYNCKGRVIITGMGKSGAVARKIAATFASTGTPAYFVHAAEGVHGDLGVLKKEDVVICISKSGNTDELYQILPVIKRIGIPIIGIVGTRNSLLAKNSDILLDVSVEKEACPLDLAPTASTTAAMVMGDALAVALLERRNFSREDFALIHPGGNLGKKLILKVKDVMYVDDAIPIVKEDAPFKEMLIEMNRKRFGSTCVVDKRGILKGIITDGDLKRILEITDDLGKLKAKEIMSKQPKTIDKDSLAVKALSILEKYNIMQIVVVNSRKKPIGMIHLHDLLEAGIV